MKDDDTDLQPITVGPERLPQLTGLSRTVAYELLKDGTLPSFKVGKRRLIRVADIEATMERLARQGASL